MAEAARREARRQKILQRGTDRLAFITGERNSLSIGGECNVPSGLEARSVPVVCNEAPEEVETENLSRVGKNVQVLDSAHSHGTSTAEAVKFLQNEDGAFSSHATSEEVDGHVPHASMQEVADEVVKALQTEAGAFPNHATSMKQPAKPSSSSRFLSNKALRAAVEASRPLRLLLSVTIAITTVAAQGGGVLENIFTRVQPPVVLFTSSIALVIAMWFLESSKLQKNQKGSLTLNDNGDGVLKTSKMVLRSFLIAKQLWLCKIVSAGYVRMATKEKTPMEFVAAVKDCSKRRDLETGKQLHRDAVAAGFKDNKFLCSVLITMYGKCGSIALARKVFDEMTQKDVVVWTALILGYTDNGEGSTALDLFTRMNCAANSFTYVAALKACGCMASQKPSLKAISLQSGIELHSQVKSRGFDSNTIVSNTLMDMYCKCGSIERAWKVFEGMSSKSVVTWNSLMSGYVQEGENFKAMELLDRMDCKPDAWTYAIVLKACGCLARGSLKSSERQSYLEKGMALHRETVKHGFSSDIILANTLVDMYSNCGSMAHAREVFDRMLRKSVISWNALILGYVENGESHTAIKLFSKMDCEPSPTTYVAVLKAYGGLASATESEEEKQECLAKGIAIYKQFKRHVAEPDIFVESALVDMYCKCSSMSLAKEAFDRMSVKDVVTWTALILGYVRNGDSSLALGLFFSMDCAPNSLTYSAALKACGRLASEKEAEKEKRVYLEKGRSIHEQVKDQGLESDLSVGSSLVEMYTLCGDVRSAREVFDKMAAKNVVTWTYLILAYVEGGESSMALDLFLSMDCEPDSVAYVAALKACGSLATPRAGERIHAKVSRAGMEQTVANALIGFYGKCGNMAKAEEIFNNVASPGVVSWNALIAAYSAFGDSDRVFQLAGEMRLANVEMNGITFVCILTACSHAGMVDKGKRLFEFMRANLTLEHYNCMVDILGRANRLEEAVDLIRSMPAAGVDAGEVTWRALLGACRKWKNVELGKVAFDKVVAARPKDSSAYVLMSDLYGSLKTWEQMEQIDLKIPGRAGLCDSQGGTVEFGEAEDKLEEKYKDAIVRTGGTRTDCEEHEGLH